MKLWRKDTAGASVAQGVGVRNADREASWLASKIKAVAVRAKSTGETRREAVDCAETLAHVIRRES